MLLSLKLGGMSIRLDLIDLKRSASGLSQGWNYYFCPLLHISDVMIVVNSMMFWSHKSHRWLVIISFNDVDLRNQTSSDLRLMDGISQKGVHDFHRYPLLFRVPQFYLSSLVIINNRCPLYVSLIVRIWSALMKMWLFLLFMKKRWRDGCLEKTILMFMSCWWWGLQKTWGAKELFSLSVDTHAVSFLSLLLMFGISFWRQKEWDVAVY